MFCTSMAISITQGNKNNSEYNDLFRETCRCKQSIRQEEGDIAIQTTNPFKIHHKEALKVNIFQINKKSPTILGLILKCRVMNIKKKC